jgi:hypothetical protein
MLSEDIQASQRVRCWDPDSALISWYLKLYRLRHCHTQAIISLEHDQIQISIFITHRTVTKCYRRPTPHACITIPRRWVYIGVGSAYTEEFSDAAHRGIEGVWWLRGCLMCIWGKLMEVPVALKYNSCFDKAFWRGARIFWRVWDGLKSYFNSSAFNDCLSENISTQCYATILSKLRTIWCSTVIDFCQDCAP